MKQKIAIVTDSSSSLDYINHDAKDVYMTRMPIHFGEHDFIDGVTITVEEFYQRLETDDVVPSTAQPPLGETLVLYEQLKAKGYTDIIHYPISKGLSGTYQSLFTLKDAVDGLNVHIVDTKATALILGHMVIEAAKLVEAGKTVKEILDHSVYLADHFKVYFMVDDLKYIIKNGRLSNASGFLGNLLKVKPILTFNDKGEVVGTDKIRTTKKAVNHVIEAFNHDKKQYKKIMPFLAYGGDKELTNYFKSQVAQKVDLPIDGMFESILPSVIAAHAGPRIIGLGYFIEEK